MRVMDKMHTAKDNVQVTETPDSIIIKLDKRQDFGLSASGKTHVIASTGGFMQLQDGLMLNLNLVKK